MSIDSTVEVIAARCKHFFERVDAAQELGLLSSDWMVAAADEIVVWQGVLAALLADLGDDEDGST